MGAVSGSALCSSRLGPDCRCLGRYRVDRHLEWLLIGLGALGWAVGQLIWILQITLFDSTTWPSFADIGYLVWPIGAIGAIVVHTRPFERSTRIVFMVDAMVLAVALSFVAWEVIIRAGVGDPARFSLPAQLAMLIYPLTDIALASMLGLMLLIGRSPARVCLLAGALLLTVADIAYSATVGSTSNVVVRRVVPVLGSGVRGHRPDRRPAEWGSRSLHPPDAVSLAGRAPAGDGRRVAGGVAVHDARQLSDHGHHRHRCARRFADHRRAVGHLEPLDDVVGSAQRQHHQPATHRGRATCAARRPSRFGDRARRPGAHRRGQQAGARDHRPFALRGVEQDVRLVGQAR